MFYHMHLAKSVNHTYNSVEYEVFVHRAEEDGHLRGYIYAGGYGDRIVGMSGKVASDLAHDNKNPVEMLINNMIDEIDAGKFPIPSGS